MKKEKITTKLSLNKSTIANLTSHEMNDAHGGLPTLSQDMSICAPTCWCTIGLVWTCMTASCFIICATSPKE